MPRIARVVIPGLPHHVTQRGSGKQDMFLSDTDRLVYVDLLRKHAERFCLRLWAWCLMSNHVHLLAVPEHEDSLARAMGRTQAQYAQYWNARKSDCGHAWQARYYSCPVEEQGAWAVTRYIEMNPVRAGMVAEAEDWRWSSAGAHLGGPDEFRLLDPTSWTDESGNSRWRQVLRMHMDDGEWQQQLEEATFRGRPMGADAFIADLESRLNRRLRPKPVGRPRKQAEECAAGERQMAMKIGN